MAEMLATLATLLWAALALLVLVSQGYAILARFLRLLLHTYFRKIVVYGLNNFPREGPVILCPNHPNMLVDAILVITECAQHGRNPYVWAKGSLFGNPLVSFLLRRVGAVPVYRPRRKEESLADVDSDKTPEELEAANRAMFEHSWRVLAGGNVMVLFPEGTSYTAPKMLSLRTGVVRVATGFAKNYDQPIPIIPVGLNYFNKDHFRSQMTLEFGPPMMVTPEMVQTEAFQQDEHSEVKRLTHVLEERMHDVTLNASDFSTIRVARMMRRLYLKTPGSIDANKEVRLTQHIINMLELEPRDENQQKQIAAIREKVQRYKDELDRLRLKDQEVILPIPKEQSLLQMFLERTLYILVLLPLATPGLLLNFPYYFIGTSCYPELSKSMFKIFAAAVLVPVHWLVLILAMWYFLGAAYAYVLAVGLPVLLYSHIRVLEESRSIAENVLFLFNITAHADQVTVIRKERESLAQEVHELITAYARQDPQEEGTMNEEEEFGMNKTSRDADPMEQEGKSAVKDHPDFNFLDAGEIHAAISSGEKRAVPTWMTNLPVEKDPSKWTILEVQIRPDRAWEVIEELIATVCIGKGLVVAESHPNAVLFRKKVTQESVAHGMANSATYQNVFVRIGVSPSKLRVVDICYLVSDESKLLGGIMSTSRPAPWLAQEHNRSLVYALDQLLGALQSTLLSQCLSLSHLYMATPENSMDAESYAYEQEFACAMLIGLLEPALKKYRIKLTDSPAGDAGAERATSAIDATADGVQEPPIAKEAAALTEEKVEAVPSESLDASTASNQAISETTGQKIYGEAVTELVQELWRKCKTDCEAKLRAKIEEKQQQVTARVEAVQDLRARAIRAIMDA
ncbi:hypothetical protein BBJ28_00012209 [Nothophytophthora sp. Chile5]|nr:hypothetical protein BBJ28_00012209 [Nothophytophthora sp. Chile5]